MVTNRVFGSRIGTQTAAPPQHMMEESSTKKCKIGQRIQLDDGRVFYYALNGGTALDANKLVCAKATVGQNNLAVAAAVAVRDKKVQITNGATAIVANQYENGYFTDYTNGDGTLSIAGNDVEATGSLDFWLRLNDGIYTALTTSSKVSICENPFFGVVISSADQSDLALGVPLIDVTADYYCWIQTWGMASVWQDESITLGATGAITIGSSVPGAVELLDAAGEQNIGQVVLTTVNTKYNMVYFRCCA